MTKKSILTEDTARAVLESSPTAMVWVNRQGHILLATEGFKQLIGESPSKAWEGADCAHAFPHQPELGKTLFLASQKRLEKSGHLTLLDSTHWQPQEIAYSLQVLKNKEGHFEAVVMTLTPLAITPPIAQRRISPMLWMGTAWITCCVLAAMFAYPDPTRMRVGLAAAIVLTLFPFFTGSGVRKGYFSTIASIWMGRVLLVATAGLVYAALREAWTPIVLVFLAIPLDLIATFFTASAPVSAKKESASARIPETSDSSTAEARAESRQA